MKKKILVLGASSFAGYSYLEQNKKDQILATYSSNISNTLQKKLSNNVILLKITNYKKILNIIKNFKPNIVIDFSSYCMVQESWSNTSLYIKKNIMEKSELLTFLSENKFIKKYIYISTPEVFGSVNKTINEKHSIFNPSTPYAVSKLSYELLLKSYYLSKKFPSIIARFSNFYGPGQPVYRLIPKLITCINKNLKFPLQGKGTTKRNFIFKSDFLAGIEKCILLGKPGEIYHFSGKEFVSIRYLIKAICEAKGVKFDNFIKQVPERVGKDYIYKLGTKITRRNLKWKPEIGIKKGIAKTILFYDRHSKKINLNELNFKFK